MDGDILIHVENVQFKYYEDEDWVLKGPEFSVKKGEWVSIIGHNGSGKSTLAKCFNGLLKPQKGTIIVDGFQAQDDESLWEIRRRVGMVFQNPDNQFVGTTVKDDVAFGMENHGLPREEMVRRLDESLTLVGMSDYLDSEPHRLSGGQKQRVALAGIIALQPKIVVLDEATSMLDPGGRKAIMDIMRNLNRNEGITVISITHDLEETLDADNILVMNDGRIFSEGPPEAIFAHPEVLDSIGLDLPFTVKLKKALEPKGVTVDDTIIRKQELLEALWTLKSKI